MLHVYVRERRRPLAAVHNKFNNSRHKALSLRSAVPSGLRDDTTTPGDPEQQPNTHTVHEKGLGWDGTSSKTKTQCTDRKTNTQKTHRKTKALKRTCKPKSKHVRQTLCIVLVLMWRTVVLAHIRQTRREVLTVVANLRRTPRMLETNGQKRLYKC